MTIPPVNGDEHDQVKFEVREIDPKHDLGPINGKVMLRTWHHQGRSGKWANTEFLTRDQLVDLYATLGTFLGDM